MKVHEMDHCFSSSLTLGATGMLAQALQFVADHSDKTWVLARRGHDFIDRHPIKGCTGRNIDYSDHEAFWQMFDREIDSATLNLALLWVHDGGKETLIKLLKLLTDHAVTTIHVSGSATGDPNLQMERVAKHIAPAAQQHYIHVVLGAMKTPTGQRWLTHDEISQGAIEAIKTGTPQMVGTKLTAL